MKNKGPGNMKLFIFGKSTNSRFVGSKRMDNNKIGSGYGFSDGDGSGFGE